MLRKVGADIFEVRVVDEIWRQHKNQLLKYQGHPVELDPESVLS